MKFVIQRVNRAEVSVEGESVGSIQKGFLVLIGVCDTDSKETADKMIHKMTGLRIFEDTQGKTNLALKDVGGSLLLVSQFTLYANCRKGFRPSFTDAGSPRHAKELYEYIINARRNLDFAVETGVFGAHMNVSLENDGPFTIVLDSAVL